MTVVTDGFPCSLSQAADQATHSTQGTAQLRSYDEIARHWITAAQAAVKSAARCTAPLLVHQRPCSKQTPPQLPVLRQRLLHSMATHSRHFPRPHTFPHQKPQDSPALSSNLSSCPRAQEILNTPWTKSPPMCPAYLLFYPASPRQPHPLHLLEHRTVYILGAIIQLPGPLPPAAPRRGRSPTAMGARTAPMSPALARQPNPPPLCCKMPTSMAAWSATTAPSL